MNCFFKHIKSKVIILLLLFIASFPSFGQRDFYRFHPFSKADTLRGMLSPERLCYDVHFYDLFVEVNIQDRSLKGYNDIYFRADSSFQRLQIDLFHNMSLDSILFEGEALDFERSFNAVFVDFPIQNEGAYNKFRVFFHGQPKEAADPPWDGGFVWEKDKNNNPWIGVSCEGLGASLWWPNKDHLSDEPDSMNIQIVIPDSLYCVSNGNLREVQILPQGKLLFDWFVSYPINNYNVSLNIGDYVHFTDVYMAHDSQLLNCDYYVMPYNLSKAQKHFKQVSSVLSCYEYYFGKYPFWEDGYALVESPYFGMEHQSAIAYGNQYQKGYLGEMIPRGMSWDYIIVHETAHEWWGNSVSCRDHGEMWLHESLATYMEALYVECVYGFEQALKYLNFQRPLIENKEPVHGPYNVNWHKWEGSDHYYKGAWMIHTLRSIVNDDELWFGFLREFYEKNKFQCIGTQDFIAHWNTASGKDYTPFFEQYLYFPEPPTLEYKLKNNENGLSFSFRWRTDVERFSMPMGFYIQNLLLRVHPTDEWQEIFLNVSSISDFSLATELFYVNTEQLD